MKRLHYTITTIDPLIIATHSDNPNMTETLQYIRGTVMQGVFAQYFLKQPGYSIDEFSRLIIKGDCIFSNAFPIRGEDLFYPAPVSIVSEKYNETNGHNLLVSETSEQTKGISGLICMKGDSIQKLSFRREIKLHNEIDDQKRTTKEGKLFNYQSIPAGIVFAGQITIRNGHDEDKIKGIMGDKTELRIGRSSMTEYGRVLFEWKESDNSEKVGENPVLVLLSDTIIYNAYGLGSPSIADLEVHLKGSLILKSIAKPNRIEGFLNIWKLKKPSETVFAAGSVFLLDKVPGNAQELIDFGLGERTQEGYGQISFSFIEEKLEVFGILKAEYFQEQTSSSEMPELTKRILQNILLNRKMMKLSGDALMDAEATQHCPTNHLIGKLKAMSQNPLNFTANLAELKKPAVRQLEKSHIGNRTMYEFIQDRIGNFSALCPLTEIFEGWPFDFSQEKANMQKVYFEQYFNHLRRKNK
jgi:CRISPR-associated protein Csx10